jgi:hypothetical protein
MSAPPTDGAVVAALADDLDVGFVELFNVHRQAVFSTALRVSGRWAEAQDLTAETFLRAYRALTDYDTERITALQPRPWLLTITLNLWRNAQRAVARPRPCWTTRPSRPMTTKTSRDRFCATKPRGSCPICSPHCLRNNASLLSCVTSSTCRSPRSPKYSADRRELSNLISREACDDCAS